jgi:hypothetical protein
MNSVNILQSKLLILTNIYISKHNMFEHPVGADLDKLAEISQLMSKISIISGKPLPPFIITSTQISIPKSRFTRILSSLYKPIKYIRSKIIL